MDIVEKAKNLMAVEPVYDTPTIVALIKEIERLRNVLKRIVDIDWQFANSGTLERIEGRCAVIARAALKEGE